MKTRRHEGQTNKDIKGTKGTTTMKPGETINSEKAKVRENDFRKVVGKRTKAVLTNKHATRVCA